MEDEDVRSLERVPGAEREPGYVIYSLILVGARFAPKFRQRQDPSSLYGERTLLLVCPHQIAKNAMEINCNLSRETDIISILLIDLDELYF